MAIQHLVVDTDIFIWLARGKKEAARYGRLVSGKRMVLSFASVAELWRGAYTQKYNAASQAKLEAAIGLAVVVPPTNDLTHEWARLTADARAASHPLGQKGQAHDAWIAATAKHFDIPLLTGNESHFRGIDGLKLVSLMEDDE